MITLGIIILIWFIISIIEILYKSIKTKQNIHTIYLFQASLSAKCGIYIGSVILFGTIICLIITYLP